MTPHHHHHQLFNNHEVFHNQSGFFGSSNAGLEGTENKAVLHLSRCTVGTVICRPERKCRGKSVLTRTEDSQRRHRILQLIFYQHSFSPSATELGLRIFYLLKKNHHFFQNSASNSFLIRLIAVVTLHIFGREEGKVRTSFCLF